MFTLILSRCGYVRVRKGVTFKEIERAYCCNVKKDVKVGQIICIPKEPKKIYRVDVGESYFSIAQKLHLDERLLREENDDKPIYPTCKIYLP